ncbi:hypothetical protein LTR91_005489 [Friedmanniomyces endolithicus]|uniref:Apple domain-containing protein n=1 Tax=Friedmanniomyces endolithicus TaxID=329885 RepID=A0AAN6KTA7_9PEZI|nr:hypothetical protein LTR01_006264 [Friedmanniomyces endolithicus]KAK0322487.1 hypothetical protein LTR82_006446 [Friedmanniomyces endolithicus]KAK0824980.1 hypothetical protein LTR73_007267 [Friedmanniomyces endolithicus]KAK0921996.1 hypothetical protein LTR57_008140 [Friedmanniomyces endolithicus]KAK0966646.1 hypothetical protein LTS01_017672 [Friedmanniomyces endolithicus]
MEVAPSNGPVAVPRDSEGLQAYNDSRPIQAYGDNSRPVQAYDNARPSQAYDDVRSAQAYEDKRPMQTYSDGDPSVTGGYKGSPRATQTGYRAVGVDEDGTHKRLCGVRPVTLWLSAALVFAMVALGAVAGGLGSGMKSANDRAIYWYVGSSPVILISNLPIERDSVDNGFLRSATNPPGPTTVTVAHTATISAAAASTTTGGLFVDYAAPLPSMISTVALDCPSLDKQSYLTRRNQTYTLSCFAGLYAGDFADIAAYSFQDCVEACSSHNYWTHNATSCVGALFSVNMSASGTRDYGNCWLKGPSMVTIVGQSGDLSATLQT